MIVIRQWAGLGNQMFIYAYYRALQMRGHDVKLDISYYDTLQAYGGKQYNIPLVFPNTISEYATAEECAGLAVYKMDKMSRVIRKLGINKKTYLSQTKKYKDCGYVDELMHIENRYVEGYFQSEKYFADIRERLLKEFTFKIDQPYPNDYLDRITKCSNAVSVHIRRGDYVSMSDRNLSDTDYYKNAIQMMKHKVPEAVFFVFSDDITWCERYFADMGIEAEFVYIKNQPRAYYDMYLMTQCRHNIIADSTFSWWGAWLNQHDEKIVFAPDAWLPDSKFCMTDIIPESWVRVGSERKNYTKQERLDKGKK